MITMRKKMSDRIWMVKVTGFVIQKEYMDEPDTWDVLDPLQWDEFVDVPTIQFTEMVADVKPIQHHPNITKCELCKK